MTTAARRLLLESVGWILLVVGVAALFLPGPGLLLTFAGLAVLSGQYVWARRLTGPVRVRAWLAAVEGAQTVPRIALSACAALLVGAVGALWVWAPPPPGWWPLPDGWWLFGGPVVGYTLIGSCVLALGLLAFSVHRFHRRPAAVAEVMRMRTDHRVKVARRREARHRLNRQKGRPDRFWHGRL